MLELPRSPGTWSNTTPTPGPPPLPPLTWCSTSEFVCIQDQLDTYRNRWFQPRDYLFYRRLWCVWSGWSVWLGWCVWLGWSERRHRWSAGSVAPRASPGVEALLPPLVP